MAPPPRPAPGRTTAAVARPTRPIAAPRCPKAARMTLGTELNDRRVIRFSGRTSAPLLRTAGDTQVAACSGTLSIWRLGKSSGIVFTAATRTTETQTQSGVNVTQCGCSSAGRAPPCQGGCREFESRQPLAGHRSALTVGWPRGEATACKAVYTGSNPVPTSIKAEPRHFAGQVICDS